MTPQELERAISVLSADSGGIAFTGFVTNAKVLPGPMLVGQIWRHARAQPSGWLADGHHISTSCIDEAHFANESIWVVTENGSVYAILSFVPSGKDWFDELRRLGDDRPYSALCMVHGETYIPAPRIRSGDDRKFGSAKKPLYPAGGAVTSTSGKRHPSRPPPNDYVKQMAAHHEQAVAALRKRGLKTPRDDNPGGHAESDE